MDICFYIIADFNHDVKIYIYFLLEHSFSVVLWQDYIFYGEMIFVQINYWSLSYSLLNYWMTFCLIFGKESLWKPNRDSSYYRIVCTINLMANWVEGIICYQIFSFFSFKVFYYNVRFTLYLFDETLQILAYFGISRTDNLYISP